MFTKLKNTISNSLKNPIDGIGLGIIQKALEERLERTVEEVFSERKTDLLNSNLSPLDQEKILKEYLLKNVAVASASSFIPGPAGILASVPTMMNSLVNQMKATYDISCAYGKEEKMIKDLFLDIPLQSMGISTGLAQRQNLEDFSDLENNQIKDKIIAFGKEYAKKKIKGSVTKSVPGLGTIFAIAEAKMETEKTIKTATSFFDPTQVIINPAKPDASKEDQAQEEKVKVLINLMTIDNMISPEETSCISKIIENSSLSDDKKSEYQSMLTNPSTCYDTNHNLIKEAGLGESTVLDMVVVAQRDKTIVIPEKEYIQEIASHLGIEASVYNNILG